MCFQNALSGHWCLGRVLANSAGRLSEMNRQTLAARINDRCRLVGTFTLRWARSPTTTSTSTSSKEIRSCSRRWLQPAVALIPPGTEVLAGLELGGVPIATALSLATGLEAVFVRKAAKQYGTAKLAEGGRVAGRQLLVVEDVITTGGQVAMSTEDLRGLGATVDHVLCVIDRSGGHHDALSAAGLSLSAVFTTSDLDAAAGG